MDATLVRYRFVKANEIVNVPYLNTKELLLEINRAITFQNTQTIKKSGKKF